MIAEVKAGRACDSLVTNLEREIDLSAQGIIQAEAVLSVMEKRLKLAEEAQRIQGQRVLNSVGENLELRKQLRREKRLKWLTLGGALLLVVLI